LQEAGKLQRFERLDALGRIGQAILSAGDTERAKSVAEEALKTAHSQAPLKSRVYLKVALACAEVGATQTALAILDSRETLVEDTEAVRLLARLGQWDRITPLLERVSGLSRVYRLGAVAETAMQQGERELADRWMELIRKEAEGLNTVDQAEALLVLARLLRLRGDRSDAEKLTRTAFEAVERTGNLTALRNLATRLAQAGNQSLAVKSLLAAEDASLPFWEEAGVAEALATTGQSQEAVAAAQAILSKLDGDNSKQSSNRYPRNLCLRTLVKAGQPDLAQEALSKLDDAEDQVDLLLEIARFYQQSRQSAAAEAALTRALDVLNHSRADALFAKRAELAAVLDRIGRQERARALLLEALRRAEETGAEIFIDTFIASTPVLAALDQGRTLIEVLHAMERVPQRLNIPLAESGNAPVVRLQPPGAAWLKGGQ
jgi:hypothetical protein